MTLRQVFFPAAATVALLVPAIGSAADAPPDGFVAGYVAAVMERELSMKADGIGVKDGRVTYAGPAMSSEQKAQFLKVLGSVPGVKDVTVIEPGVDATPPAVSSEPIEAVTLTSAASKPTTAPADEVDATKLRTADQPLTLYLGAGRTFSPILADPRWPHFSASYNYYNRDTSSADLHGVGNVAFGETIALIRQTYPSGFKFEAGIQAGLFAIFDLNSESSDLINADYFVGPYVALRQDKLSLLTRVYHQSSHLGDEFILRGDAPERQNYSFETINFLLSYDLPKGFRIYGGGGYKFDVDPNRVDPWTLEYGVEWISPDTLPGVRWARPVAAIDFQHIENENWHISYSIRAGVQLEDPTRFTQRLQIMLEYYDGDSPNGQLYDEHIRFIGIGAHFYF